MKEDKVCHHVMNGNKDCWTAGLFYRPKLKVIRKINSNYKQLILVKHTRVIKSSGMTRQLLTITTIYDKVRVVRSSPNLDTSIEFTDIWVNWYVVQSSRRSSGRVNARNIADTGWPRLSEHQVGVVESIHNIVWITSLFI